MPNISFCSEVNPIPTANDKATIVTFLWLNPALAIISIPLVRIVPNIIIVPPPKTDSGNDEKKLPIGGSKPTKIIQIAPVAIVKRLTTFVILIKPTFWLKEVIGGQPNNDEIELQNPSQAKESEISSSVTSRFNPEFTRAEVSPIVSVAETKKITTTAIIAPRSNFILKGSKWDKAINPPLKITDKSTFPIKIARI